MPSILALSENSESFGDLVIVTIRGGASTKAHPAHDIVTVSRSRILGFATGQLECMLADVAGGCRFFAARTRTGPVPPGGRAIMSFLPIAKPLVSIGP